ncbi:mCG144852, partial [Mus musculus]
LTPWSAPILTSLRSSNFYDSIQKSILWSLRLQKARSSRNVPLPSIRSGYIYDFGLKKNLQKGRMQTCPFPFGFTECQYQSLLRRNL